VALAIYNAVPKRVRNRRSVKEGLFHLRWLSDFQGALTLTILIDYIELFQEMEQLVLHPGVPDKHIWWLSPTSSFSSKTACMALFQGSIPF
jgi:hypothetical protein